MATKKKEASPKEERELSCHITDAELAEYRYRHNILQQYRALCTSLTRDLLALQKQLRDAYSLPDEYHVNLHTGEVTWKMSRLEKLHAERG